MKNKKKPAAKLELDAEIVSDLDASERETEAVKGGAYTQSCYCGGGSIRK